MTVAALLGHHQPADVEEMPEPRHGAGWRRVRDPDDLRGVPDVVDGGEIARVRVAEDHRCRSGSVWKARVRTVYTESPDSTPPREQPAVLPVGQAQLGTVEGELAVDPAGEAVADERGVDGGPEALLLVRVLREEAGHEAGAVLVEEGDGGVEVVDHDQADLRALLPLPLDAEEADGQRLGLLLAHRTGRALHADRPREPARIHVALAAHGHPELGRRLPSLARGLRGGDEAGDELLRPFLDDATDVERVADLAVERARHCGGEAIGIGSDAGDEPRAAGPVEADRHAGLAGDGAELGDGGPRTPGHGEGQARVGEHRVAGRPRWRGEERGRAQRQPRLGERGHECLLVDGDGGAERVAADAEDDGVAAPQHARGIGEDVRATFEHEPDHAERARAAARPASRGARRRR